MKNHWVETIEIYEEKLKEAYEYIIHIHNECLIDCDCPKEYLEGSAETSHVSITHHHDDCIVPKAGLWMEG